MLALTSGPRVPVSQSGRLSRSRGDGCRSVRGPVGDRVVTWPSRRWCARRYGPDGGPDSCRQDEADRDATQEHAAMSGSGAGWTRWRPASGQVPVAPASDVGFLVAAAMAPETFT